MKLVVQQNIFWLEISVNDATLVEVFDRGHQLCGVEPCAVGRVGRLVVGRQAVDQTKQVAVLGVSYDKVETSGILKKRKRSS